MKYSAGAYHLHRTGRLWWCRPLGPGSRSTSRSVTAPRFCSCCSSDATPPPRRCLLGRGELLEKQQKDGLISEDLVFLGGEIVISLMYTHTHKHKHTAGLGLSPTRISLLDLYCLLCIRLIRLNNEKGENRLPISFYGRSFLSKKVSSLYVQSAFQSLILLQFFESNWLCSAWPLLSNHSC